MRERERERETETETERGTNRQTEDVFNPLGLFNNSVPFRIFVSTEWYREISCSTLLMSHFGRYFRSRHIGLSYFALMKVRVFFFGC